MRDKPLSFHGQRFSFVLRVSVGGLPSKRRHVAISVQRALPGKSAPYDARIMVHEYFVRSNNGSVGPA